MADPRMLIDVEEIRTAFRLTEGDDSVSDVLKIIIAGCSEWVEKYCNRTFKTPITYTAEKYDGDGTPTLILQHVPVVSISALVITIDDTDDTIPATDYEFYPETGKLVLTEGDVFALGTRNVSITYIAGHSDLPPMVKLAVMKLVRMTFREWQDDRDGIVSLSRGDTTITYDRTIPKRIRELLDPYQNIVIG